MNQTSVQGVGIQWDYQPDVDLLFAWVGDPQPAENVEVEPGMYVRVSLETRNVVGIEILDCSERFQRDPSTIDALFAKQLMDALTRPALERFAALRPSPPLFSSPQ